MKQFIFSLVCCLGVLTASAQNEKFVRAMESLTPAVDSIRTTEGLNELANSFERIANAEKTQWLPFYYAALCRVNLANLYFQQQKLTEIDMILDKAEPLLTSAEALEKNNSELALLKKMYNTARMMADPMNRYMTYGMEAQTALETAKTLDPKNPRVLLMEGIDKYYTPEEYGGSKVEGRKLFEESQRLFAEFRPASSIHPDWGRSTLNYFLGLPGN